MAVIAVVPLMMKDVDLTIAGSDYAAALSAVEFVPSSSTVVFKGLKPTAVFTDNSAVEWTCNISFVQDWETATSFAKYLFTNAGSSVVMIFKPKTGGSVTVTATVVITPGSIGGSVEQHAVSTVSLGVTGTPVFS